MESSGFQEIQLWAKMHQYHLDPFALKHFSEFVSGVPFSTPDDRRRYFQEIFSVLKRVGARDRSIDLKKMEEVILDQSKKLRGGLVAKSQVSLLVVPLTSIPRVVLSEWSEELKVSCATSSITHKGRIEALQQRYLAARRRCFRSGAYRREGGGSTGNEGVVLLSSFGLEGISQETLIAVLGLLKRRDGKYTLEDTRGAVTLELDVDKGPSNDSCFIVEGCFVVVTGTWTGSFLRVRRIDLPPAESREVSLKDAGPSADLFGLASANLTAPSEQVEQLAAQSVVVFLAHIHLDKLQTMQQLKTFFTTIEARGEHELSCTSFVLIGNFCSSSLPYGDASHLGDIEETALQLKSLLEQLGNCIATYSPTAAVHSNFFLIPGPGDSTVLNGVLPQPSIPSAFTTGLTKKVKHVHLASNPCRLRFLSQEIIVSRRDYMRHFLKSEQNIISDHILEQKIRSTKNIENEEGPREHHEPFERIAKTILDEAHLCPDLLEGGVIWKMDEALSLPILPHLLLLCDSVEQWECYYKGAHVINPGSFSVSGTFLWYTPADQECAISQLS